MRGLYQKALEIYRQTTHLRLVRQEETQPERVAESDGVSPEEKRRFLEQIDELLSGDRLAVTAETLVYTPKRRGVLLPLATNLIIGAVVTLALLAAFLLYNRQEQSIAAGGAVLLTAESKLIAAMRQESEAQLKQKDQAIVEIQGRLTAVDRERQQLRSGVQAVLSAKEQELQGQFERRLNEERQRLQSQGVSAAEIQRRLADTQAALRRESEAALAAARRQAETELANKEAAIASLAGQYQRDLEQARTERSQARGELTKREAELQGQLAAREQELSSDRARVVNELSALRRQQEQERLLLDQLLAGYDRVNQNLQKGDFERALGELASQRAFFNERSVASLPTMQKRRGIEFFLIDSLEELIRGRQSRSGSDTAALLEASALIGAVGDRVRRGEELERSGQAEAARGAYRDALAQIPAARLGYSRLEELRLAEEERVRREWGALVRQGNVFFEGGSLRESLQRYQQALTLLLKDESLSRRVTENIRDAGYRLLAGEDLGRLNALASAAQKREAVLTRLRELRAQYQAYAALEPASAASELDSPQSLSTLLQAKILMRQILDTEPVRSRYPELGATMERYFEALSAQRQEDGRRAALQELDALLARLAVREGAGSAPALTSYRRGAESDPLLALLNRLETLLK